MIIDKLGKAGVPTGASIPIHHYIAFLFFSFSLFGEAFYLGEKGCKRGAR